MCLTWSLLACLLTGPQPPCLGARIQRMLIFFVKFVLDFQAGVIRFHRANAFDDRIDPAFHVPLAEFFGGYGAIAGIMIWKSRVPPDSGIQILGQSKAFLVR